MRAKIALLSGLSVAVVSVPLLAVAATLFNVLGTLNALFNGLMFLLIVVAIVVFFWGLVQYLFDIGGGEEGKGPSAAAKGIKLMLWSIIALFVMVSVWGIIRLLQQTFQVDSGAAIVPGAIQGGVFGVPGSQGVINVSGGVSIPIR